MARYLPIDTNPRFLPVDLARQLLPGTFEHALNHLIDHELDLAAFDARYRNDETGAPAYPPPVLLKVILAAYAHGVVGSRRPTEPDLTAKAAQRVARLTRDAAELRAWLAAHPDDRRGPKGTIRKSNRTDNESAKLATGKGVIQGYTGVAAVDGTHQIIVEAQAHGTGSEQELLLPVVTALRSTLASHSVITADAGYHSEANLRTLDALGVDALIADNRMRRRDERFATQARHKAAPDPLHDKSATSSPRGPARYEPKDFMHDPVARTCVCPAGSRSTARARRTSPGDSWVHTSAAPSATAYRVRIARGVSARPTPRPCGTWRSSTIAWPLRRQLRRHRRPTRHA